MIGLSVSAASARMNSHGLCARVEFLALEGPGSFHVGHLHGDLDLEHVRAVAPSRLNSSMDLRMISRLPAGILDAAFAFAVHVIRQELEEKR